MKQTYTKFFLPLLLLVASLSLRAQTYNDGCMNIQMAVGYSYIESVDDPLFGELNCNEFRFRWWGADNANLDGAGFLGGSVIGTCQSGSGWVTNQDVTLLNYTYGTPNGTPDAVPQYLQLQGETWEDDCFDCFQSTGTFTWNCNQCSSNVYDGGCGCSTNILCGCSSEDQHCGPTTVSSTINYRIAPPCQPLISPIIGNNYGWVGDYFSNVCGGDDMGAEVLARWTPPIPNVIVPTASVLCDPGLVTLQSGGAVFGGDYNWYNNSTNVLVGTGAQITPYVAAPTTFRVHTVNGGCESLDYRLITITVGSPAISSVTFTNPACNGSSNGTITVNASGGTPPLQYSINNGGTYQASNVFSNVAAGTYFIVVKDANNCIRPYISNPVILTQPPAVNIFVNQVNINCNGANTGVIQVYAGGGTGALTYSINNGSTFVATPLFTNLAAGAYNVVVHDANGCNYPFIGNPVNITQPTAVTATATPTSASCANSNNGSISIAASGGVPPYTYSLNNGPFYPTSTFTGLPSGSYTVLVADGNGCQFNTTATITNAYTMSATIVSGTDVSCAGGNDGTVVVGQTGGIAPFQYSINGGNTWQASSTFIGLSGGIYTFTVEDANGCSDIVSDTVVERPPLVVQIVSTTNVGCYGDSTGGFTASATGGDLTYSYAWSNGMSGATITLIPAGTYTVTVTDGAGCTASANGTITQNPELQLSLESIQNVGCLGGGNGFVDITSTGGVPSYTYQWSNSATSEDIHNLSGNTYAVTVTDAAGCTDTASYVVNEPATTVSAYISVTDVSCYGGSNGTATAGGLGGTPPFTYQWNTGSSAQFLTGIPASVYFVTVTDANGCSEVKFDTVMQATPFVISGVVADALCFGSSDGGVTLTVIGSNPPYQTYAWTGGSSNQNLTNVVAGNYSVTVTDNLNCTDSASFTINQPVALVSSVAGNNPDCFGNATGFAVVSAGGGTVPYIYAWSTTPTQSGVMGIHLAGNITYYVTITDGHNCMKVDSVILQEPTPVTVNTTPANVKCFEGNDGSVIIVASGGTGIYDYYLNGVFSTDSIFTGLIAGSYTVVAEDNNNCVGSATFTITEPQNFTVDAGPDQISVKGQTVQLNANATSANGILGYEWANDATLSCLGCQNPQATPLATTTYIVAAMDGDSCIGYDSVTVIVKNDFEYFIPTAFTPNNDGLNDFFEVNILGAETIAVEIFNRWGEMLYENLDQPNGSAGGNAWDGKVKGKLLPYDTYVYQIKVTFFDGEEAVVNGTIAVVK